MKRGRRWFLRSHMKEEVNNNDVPLDDIRRPCNVYASLPAMNPLTSYHGSQRRARPDIPLPPPARLLRTAGRLLTFLARLLLRRRFSSRERYLPDEIGGTSSRERRWREASQGDSSGADAGAGVGDGAGAGAAPRGGSDRDWTARGSVGVVVTNTTFRAAPWADVLYAMDRVWWRQYLEEARQSFTGQLVAPVAARACPVDCRRRRRASIRRSGQLDPEGWRWEARGGQDWARDSHSGSFLAFFFGSLSSFCSSSSTTFARNESDRCLWPAPAMATTREKWGEGGYEPPSAWSPSFPTCPTWVPSCPLTTRPSCRRCRRCHRRAGRGPRRPGPW